MVPYCVIAVIGKFESDPELLTYADQGPLLLTWFNFNPSMDK